MRINCIVTHQTLAISAPEAAEKSVSYLECAFYFLTPDWQGLEKTAFFTGTDGKNYSAVIQDGTCVVPWEATAEPGFLRMSVAGFGQMSLIITTDIASLRMRETIFGGDPSQEPSPDQYTQIMQTLSGKVDTDQGVQNSGKVLGINDSGKVEPMDNAGGGSSDLLWRPSVSESGDLSWTQDSSTDPPEAVNIMGPQGPAGKDGDPGLKGETGATGPAGKDGITPTIGENGNWYLGEADTGKPSRGEQGPKGEQGPQGGQGETGEQGPPGQTGPTGPTGATPNIQIGTVQTLEPGQQATASMSGTPENPLLNLGIPKGEKGDPGENAKNGIPSGGTTGQVLAKKSDADYDVEWTTIKNTGTVEPPSKEDTLLGVLPYKITESNCYIISETEAQITTGEGAENLYIRNGEYLVGNPEGVEWGVDSLKYTSVDNLMGVYTHVGESNSFKPNTKYTLFADFESEVSLFIRVLVNASDINSFLGNILGQLNRSGYLTFTTPENIKWLNLSFGFITKGTGKFYNIAIYEGEYTERPKGGVFTLPANTKFNTDAYIGSTLSPVNEEVVSVYKVNTEDSENETNKDGVIFFGDSILDFSGVAEKYSKRTGKPVLDCAVGGTRLSGSRDSGNEYYPYDMTNIADSIASGDFSSQVDGGKNSNFSILNSGNLSAYKTIILEFGTNDFTAKVPFNGEGVTTIEGSLKHILTTILTKYPTMRIVVFSTLHYVTAGKGEESGVPTHTDGTVWQMNEVIKSICESDDYCVPFIDMYHLFTENKLTRDILTSDGVHLSSSYGAPRYADIMTAQLNSIGV